VRHSDGNYVCVKRPLPPGNTFSGRLVETELNILRSIDHPNIVKAFEIVVDGTNMSLVIEQIPGCSLHQAVITAPMCQLDEIVAQPLCFKLFQGVAHLHSKRICHQDINPDNVRVSDDHEDLKLTDFEAASRFDVPKNLLQQSLCDAPQKLPEQTWAEASDVWGAGVCLHVMLSGKKPCINSKAASFSELNLPENVWCSVSSSCIEILELSLETECNQKPAASELLQLQWMDVNTIR